MQVWFIDANQGGLIRKQDHAVISFDQANGFFCENPADFQDTVDCTALQAKVYLLRAGKGLIRKQSGEVRSFESSKGYLCVSPADLKILIEECPKAEGQKP